MRITGVSLLFSLLLGLVFAAVHLFNSWAFSALEFSSFISLVYLPGFLRLANVLVMGPLWGSLATAFGHLMLLLVELRPVDLALVNLLASVLGADGDWRLQWRAARRFLVAHAGPPDGHRCLAAPQGGVSAQAKRRVLLRSTPSCLSFR